MRKFLKIQQFGARATLLLMLVNQLMWPLTVWSQEATEAPSPTPEVVVDTKTEEPPTPTTTPTNEEATAEITGTVVENTDSGSQSSATVPEITVAPNNPTPTTEITGKSVEQTTPIPTTTIIPDETINTGEAVAFANLVNLINTQTSGGNLGIYFYNNFNGNFATLDLNELWKEIQNGEDGIVTIQENENQDNTNLVVISNNNLAMVDNVVTVVANSGGNTVSGSTNNALIVTGDATALANVVNLVNSNIEGSQFFIGVVNVDAENLGDLVLPAPENFQSQGDIGELATINSNSAELNNNINTTANSGENSIYNSNQATIQTGEATAYNSNYAIVNVNESTNSQLFVVVNVLGTTNGKVYNWNYPGSEENLNNGQQFFALGTPSDNLETGSGVGIYNENSAVVNNTIVATANSGNNLIEGAEVAQINTGKVSTAVNLANIINLNTANSKWFLGIINVVGNWNGNIIFAYPDLAVEIESPDNETKVGEPVNYIIKYKNLGYEDAVDTELAIQLPDGVVFTQDDSGTAISNSERILKWKIGKIKAKSQNYFTIKTKLMEENVALGDKKNKLIPAVLAADNYWEKELKTEAIISTKSTESNINNNSSTIITKALLPLVNNGSDVDSRQPDIQIQAKNNVNNYVLPGDIVTFEIDVTNKGEGLSKDSVLVHQIYDRDGNLWKNNEIYIGDIKPNRSGKVNFGIVMNISNPGAKEMVTFRTSTQIVGKYGDNEETKSNNANTNYQIKFPLFNPEPIQAVEINKDVLGVSVGNLCMPKDNLIPYLLLFIISTLWIYKQTHGWIKEVKEYEEKTKTKPDY